MESEENLLKSDSEGEDASPPCSQRPQKNMVEITKVKQKEKPRPEVVQLPTKDWDDMKKQNERILRALKKWDAEEGEIVEDEDSECVQLRSSSPLKKKRRREEDSTVSFLVDNSDEDLDYQIENLTRVRSCGDQTENRSDENAESDTLTGIQQDYEADEELGDDISEQLAKIVNMMAKGKMNEAKMKDKISEHKRPKNVELKVPRVNHEVWDTMDHNQKSADLRTQRIQHILLTAVNALVCAANECVGKTNIDVKKQMKSLTDSMGLILKATHEMSMDRRVSIMSAPQFNKKYKKLVSSEIPVTTELFGDDLRSVFASIDSSSKLGMAITRSSRGDKFFPFRGGRTKNWDYDQSQRRGRGWTRGRARGYYPRYRGRSFRGQNNTTFKSA
ncbi:uncharacterized protein [Littorina saxatilis]|uniref:uncharacterized protein n=1 Tax=Littorina saxatilis TaxID=31220 RepID=UPI0038B4C55F